MKQQIWRQMMNEPRTSIKKLPHLVIVRAPSLLAMDYKIQEIVEELGVPNSTLRDWLNKGAPHHRDRRGHIWINGAEFAKWVETQRKKPRKKKLADDEAFCFRCNRAVKLINPQIIPIVGKLINIRGKCHSVVVLSIVQADNVKRDNFFMIKFQLKYT
jgi:hypothetical protein